MTLKIAWIGISCEAKTGYGKISRSLISNLLDKYEIISLAHGGDSEVWGGERYIQLGGGKEVLTLPYVNPLKDPSAASQMVNMYAKIHGCNFAIGFWDAMALGWFDRLNIPAAQYIPIDGPMTSTWADFTKDAMKVIAYSKFGYSELQKYVTLSRLSYIEHGIDTEVFFPIQSRSKSDLRGSLADMMTTPVPKEAFLFCTVEANYTDRKKLPLLLDTFASLAKIHHNEDIHIYVHCNSRAWMGRGYNLEKHVKDLGVADRVHFPKYDPSEVPISDDKLNEVLNSADTYLTDSCAEGFGVPLLEAMSAGIPCITPRNSSQNELVEGHGYIAENIDTASYKDYPIYVPYMNFYPVCDQKSLLGQMADAIELPETRLKYGKESREFAKGYDWKIVMKKWETLLQSVDDELSMWKSVLA